MQTESSTHTGSEFRVGDVNFETLKRSHRLFAPIVKRYFRSEVRGMERVPTTQTILVSHHDGGVLPINGVCLEVSWHEHHGFKRPLYVLTHDALHGISNRFSRLLSELGVIRADRKAMDAALGTGASVLVFPGAARESFRTYWQRREIDLGRRMGFVAQAIRWQLPITPVVSVGSHETVFVLHGGHNLARRLRVPQLVRSGDVLPLMAGLPWGIWALPFLPQFPLPAKITTEVLEPIWLADGLRRPLTRDDADDAAVVTAGFELVIGRMRACMNRLYAERRYPIVG